MRVIVFAGPNGSGKSSVVTERLNDIDFPDFISPDYIAKTHPDCQAIEDYHKKNILAANMAEQLREQYVSNKEPFAFETVLSTPEKLEFLRKIKESGYSVQSIYVTTKNPEINVKRVADRVSKGGHNVPSDKIHSRYHKSMSLLPELLALSDFAQVFDNSDEEPVLIYQKASEFHGIMNFGCDVDYVESKIIMPLMSMGLINKNILEFTKEQSVDFEVYAKLINLYSESYFDPLKIKSSDAYKLYDETIKQDRVLNIEEIESLLNI